MISIYNNNNNDNINNNISNWGVSTQIEFTENTLVTGSITSLNDGLYTIEFDDNTKITVPQENITGNIGETIEFDVIDKNTLKQVNNTNQVNQTIDKDVEIAYNTIQTSIKNLFTSDDKYNKFLIENKQADLDKITLITDIKNTLSEMSNNFTDSDLKALIKSNLNAKNLDVFEFSDYIKESTGVDTEGDDKPEEKTLLELREDKKKYMRMDLNMNGVDEEDAMRFEKILTQADLPITAKNISDIRSMDKKFNDIRNLDDKNIFSAMKVQENSINNSTNKSINKSSKNNLASNTSTSITIDDLYSSKHSGASAFNSANLSNLNNLQDIPNLDEQIQNIFNQDNIEFTQENLELAKNLIANDLEISIQNFNIYNKIKNLVESTDINIDSIIAQNLKNKDLSITNNISDFNNYKNMIPSITEEHLQILINQNMPINLHNIASNFNNNKYSDTNNNTASNTTISQTAISEKLNLARIQMKMTMENMHTISKAGVNIDTMSLAKVITTLEEAEEINIKSQLAQANAPITQENIGIMKSVSETINNFYPNNIYSTFRGIITEEIDFSLDGINKNFKASGILETLDNFRTQPIKKFGDGISQLDDQFEEFLEAHGFGSSEANKKALKILTSNDIEFTEENLIQTKIIDEKLEYVHNNLHPLTVSKMLRDDFNPMDKNIDEVIDYLDDPSNNFGATSREQIASQILEIDKDNSLSANERKAVISIYRMLNSIEKNDSGAIGNILQSEKNLTFKNLLEASKLHTTRKQNISIDKKVDNSTGELQIKPSNSIESIISSSIDSIKSNTENLTDLAENNNLNNLNNLESLNKEYNNLLIKDFIKNGSSEFIENSLFNNLENNSLENINNINNINNTHLENLESEFIKNVRDIENTAIDVINAIIKHDMPVTMNNIQVMENIVNDNKKPAEVIDEFREDLRAEDIEFGEVIFSILNASYLDNRDDSISKEEILRTVDKLQVENEEVFDEILELDELDNIKMMIIKNQSVSKNIKFLQDNNKIKNGLYSLPIELSSGKISDLNMYILNDEALDNKNLTMYLNFTNENNQQIQAYIESEQNGKVVTISGDGVSKDDDVLKILEKFNITPEEIKYNSREDINIFQDPIVI